MTQKTNGMQADNCKNNEIKNGMSQVINILTGETKKIRCHYISHRTDKPVSRVLTLERLNHPALTAAGVTAWAERFNDGVNRFDWLRVSIQLTDKICYTPNCTNVGLPDVENYGNLDYYMGQEGMMRVSMNNVDNFFQSIADKPAKMMTGEDWPNMAVIAAYRAAGRDEDAETLTAARDIYNARREADKEAWSKKYAAQQTYYNSPKPKNFDDMTELDKARFMMQTAQECAKEHPELDWSDILERAEKRLERAKEITEADGIKIGDRVKVKSQDTPADVIAISEDGQYYTVKFVQPVREFWTGDPMQTATYGRYGITRNYDRMTGEERVGNATYYAEQLKYGPGSIIEYELNGVELRTESTREDVEPDSREGWGNEFRVTIRHKSGDTCDTMTLGEVAELLARLYQEAGGNMSQEFIESDEEPSLEPASEIRAYNVGDRVKRIGTGATGIVDSLGRHEGRWTYNVRYDQTQRRPSDGFEYLTEEVFAEEIEAKAA